MTVPHVHQQRTGQRRRLGGALAAATLTLTGLAVVNAPSASAATVSGGSLTWQIRHDWIEHIAENVCGVATPFASTAPATINGTPPFSTTNVPDFTWANGTGTYTSASNFTVTYAGNIRLGYCGGPAGNTYNLTDPKIEVDTANSIARIVGTVAGTTNSGTPISGRGPFPDTSIATITLGTPVISGNTATYTGVPALLTYSENLNVAWGTFPNGWQNGTPANPPTVPEAIPPDLNMAPLTFSVTSDAIGEDEEPPPDPTGEDLTQNLSVNVTQPTVAGDFYWVIPTNNTINLTGGTQVLGSSFPGGLYEYLGSLNNVEVTDTRLPGSTWTITGQVANFSPGSIFAYSLGWTPSVVTGQTGAGATAGSPVAPGTASGQGLQNAQPLATGSSGQTDSTATLDADLTLHVPGTVPTGAYTSVLTLTATGV